MILDNYRGRPTRRARLKSDPTTSDDSVHTHTMVAVLINIEWVDISRTERELCCQKLDRAVFEYNLHHLFKYRFKHL